MQATRARIGKRTVDAVETPAEGESRLWDTELKGWLRPARGDSREGSVFLDQLAQLCTLVRNESGNLVPSELELNAALNIVSGVHPRNEMEAALAAQMVAVHFMTMRVASQTLHTNWTVARTTAIAGKLARTFAMQSDALARLKGRTGKQTIKVRYERHDHRHVHVGEGSQKRDPRRNAYLPR
jgi:hypothetical protein